MGLEDIMAELYAEDRKPTDETAEEIIHRLEEKKNFIPSSERVRRQYAYALLREYRNYMNDRSGAERQITGSVGETKQVVLKEERNHDERPDCQQTTFIS